MVNGIYALTCGRVACLRLAIAGRRHDAVIVALQELGKAQAGQVGERPGYDPDAGGKPLRRETHGGDGRGQVEAARVPRPEKLVGRWYLPANDRDRPGVAFSHLVMGEGGGGGCR